MIIHAWIGHCALGCIVMCYRGILSSVVTDNSAASGVSFNPVADIVYFPLYHHPLVTLVTVFLHLFPGVHCISAPLRLELRSLMRAPTHHYTSTRRAVTYSPGGGNIENKVNLCIPAPAV